MNNQHDVLIVGGGLVGSSLAIALVRLGMRVGLVEATPAGEMPKVFDQRNLSFSAATINALTALGVMDQSQIITGPIRKIMISRAGDFGRIKLNAADYGRESFGQVVVASDFGRALEARLTQLDSTLLTRYRPAKYVALEPPSSTGQSIVIDAQGQKQTLHARLIVAADGTQSSLRDAIGVGIQFYDYQQTVFVARLRSTQLPDGTAYERLTDEGPTALLPRGDRHFGIVHGVATENVEAVANLSQQAWLARLQKVLGWRAGRFIESNKPSAYPLRRIVADKLTAQRVVLMGNAAQTIHPIGAQGFNLGLRDALTLAELIEHRQGDPGDNSLLQAYVQQRTPDRTNTLAFSDGLARLTSNPSGLLHPLRSAGLLTLSASNTLQASLVNACMGFRENVPQLCREGEL